MAGFASTEISRGRKLLAGASMLGAAGIVAYEGFAHFRFDLPPFLLFAAVLGIGGIGLTRRSLVPQVLSRGAAWIVLLPAMLIGLVYLLVDGRAPPLEIAGLAATTGAALLLARPMLHTREARAQFGPRAFRRWLLAGSTATAATGFVAGTVALSTMRESPLAGAAFGALAASMFASSLAVVRMRSWGIFLGALTSAALVVTGVVLGREAAFVLALASAPALLLHLLPVLVARWRTDPAPSNVRVTDEVALVLERVTARAPEAYTTACYRIATDAHRDDDAEGPAKAERAAMRA